MTITIELGVAVEMDLPDCEIAPVAEYEIALPVIITVLQSPPGFWGLRIM